MDENLYLAGITVGLLAAAICLLIKKGKGKEYDERQYLIRGRAFQYSFMILLFYNLLYGAAYMDEIPGWCDNFTGECVGIALAMGFFGTYCIWNDAYMNLNQNPKYVYLFLGAIMVLNLLIGIRSLQRGELLVDGRLDFHVINLVIGVLSLLFFVTFWLKNRINGREAV